MTRRVVVRLHLSLVDMVSGRVLGRSTGAAAYELSEGQYNTIFGYYTSGTEYPNAGELARSVVDAAFAGRDIG